MLLKHTILAALTAGSLVSLSIAAEPVTAEVSASEAVGRTTLLKTAPETYVVKKGDTLWDISAKYLRDPWRWPEIWHINPQIRNPHLIYPGDVLKIVWVDGQAKVTVSEAGTVRLSPEVREVPVTNALRAIPAEVFHRFVGRPTLVEAQVARKQPQVLGFRGRHLVGSVENEVYALGLDGAKPGEQFSIINIGEPLNDPKSGAVLGHLSHYAGTAEILDVTANKKGEMVAHLKVLESGREIMQGDRLFPARVQDTSTFAPSTPTYLDMEGRLLAVVDGTSVAGKYQAVAINRGVKDGLVPGNVLGVFRQGETVKNRAGATGWRKTSANFAEYDLPEERSGSIILFQVYDKVSFGFIVEATQPIVKGDFVRHPALGHRDAGIEER